MRYPKQWQFLEKAVELERIPQALLFSGQDLEGMKKVALEFIQLVNGRDVKEGHPDFYIVGPPASAPPSPKWLRRPSEAQAGKQEIKISQIRELHNRLSLRSYSAPFKSVIIDKAHTLNWEAQSAFLKLLEEPKGKTCFILITNYPDLLLDTILSRVEQIKFYSSLPQLTCSQKKMISEMLKIKKGDLAVRFQYAKKLSENPQDLRETLETWLRYFRGDLLSGTSVPEKLKTIKTLQTMHYLLSTTNINPRLALEVLMLEL